MQSDSTACGLPPSHHAVLDPITLVLGGQSIAAEANPSAPLYELGRDVTDTSPKPSSAKFERIEYEDEDLVKSRSTVSLDQRSQHLFYLTHPLHAQYRTDVPAYYITSVSPEMPGKVVFQISKTLLRKPEFKAILVPGRTSPDGHLFDSATQKTLFHVKSKWKGGQYQWIDYAGQKVAHESSKNNEYKLVISKPIDRATRDILAAAWALRLWHDVAESRKAKWEYLERMTAPDTPSPYLNMKWAKRAGALGAAAGAGAA
ncbi:hypothetical protein EDB81DRAFT_723278 [Dactylonectria macrodidyma]|uniref:Uncharacterized protein n=1 Tax=Dactylonectria macrodidyma TaxID=307937 RepID=A0A9P9J5L8_9HYPO|nr:hypothetical protein EDB81DRAFT_723278 [Dactylonectria macrodidyma]